MISSGWKIRLASIIPAVWHKCTALNVCTLSIIAFVPDFFTQALVLKMLSTFSNYLYISDEGI
jgi:hypothetical protein